MSPHEFNSPQYDSLRSAREALGAIESIAGQARAAGRELSDEEFRQIEYHQKVWAEAMQQHQEAVRQRPNR